MTWRDAVRHSALALVGFAAVMLMLYVLPADYSRRWVSGGFVLAVGALVFYYSEDILADIRKYNPLLRYGSFSDPQLTIQRWTMKFGGSAMVLGSLLVLLGIVDIAK